MKTKNRLFHVNTENIMDAFIISSVIFSVLAFVVSLLILVKMCGGFSLNISIVYR